METDGTVNVATFTPTGFAFGSLVGTGTYLNGYLLQVTQLKRRATNGELQSLTT